MPLHRSPTRVRLGGLPFLALLVVLMLTGLTMVAGSAMAQTTTTSGPTTSQAGDQTSLSQLAPGLALVSGTITGNGPESGRQLDSSQATAFVQAWLPDSVFGSPPYEDPPATLTVYQVDVEYNYQGTLGTMTVNYASDGTSAWISMPPQALWPGVNVTQQRWIKAPDRTVAGFEGQLAPVPIATAPPTTKADAATSAHHSSSSAGPLLIVGLLVVLAAIGFVVLRRRDTHATSA
jgi:hypothetical protein